MNGRLTYENENGTWGIKGYDITKALRELYGALCKLRDYERIGPTPDQFIEIDRMYTELCTELAAVKKQSLPCEPGDVVYCIENEEEFSAFLYMATCGDYVIGTSHYYGCIDFETQLCQMESRSDNNDGVEVKIFEKDRVFLTPEAAQEALMEVSNEERKHP